MEITNCKCGKSKVRFECVGEDLFQAHMENCTRKTNYEKGIESYICNNCKAIVDKSDHYMMVNWD